MGDRVNVCEKLVQNVKALENWLAYAVHAHVRTHTYSCLTVSLSAFFSVQLPPVRLRLLSAYVFPFSYFYRSFLPLRVHIQRVPIFYVLEWRCLQPNVMTFSFVVAIH